MAQAAGNCIVLLPRYLPRMVCLSGSPYLTPFFHVHLPAVEARLRP